MQFNLRRNAVWAVAEAVASGLILFLLYKLVVMRLGLEALGIWSLVLATTSLVRFADAGASSGLGRFVAISSGKGDHAATLSYFDTAILTNLGLYAAVALAFYFPAYNGLAWAVSEDAALGTARDLLPYALVSLTLGNLSAAVGATLVGLQRSDLKSMVVVVGLFGQLAAALSLVPSHGLMGLAWAQLIQNACSIVAGLALVHFSISGRVGIRVPASWSGETFRALVGFGVKLQLAAIISLLYDPATKFVMSALGGLEALGLFELANRLVFQVRLLVAAPIQTLMPAFAHLDGLASERLGDLYRQAMALTLALGTPLMVGSAVVSPLVSWIWIGQFDRLFVAFVTLLCIGWLFNLVGAPAYLLGIGTGRLWWNISGHLVTSVGGPLLGVVLGKAFGPVGVVIGAASALALGSLLTMIMNCHQQAIGPFASWRDIRSALNSQPWRARKA